MADYDRRVHTGDNGIRQEQPDRGMASQAEDQRTGGAKDYYQNKITEDSTILENLKDDRFLEQYAREHYLMKREDETIYLLK